MAFNLLNLLAIASLAVVASDYALSPVAALSSGIHQVRHIRPHDAFSKRKRDATRRCKPRPTAEAAAPPPPPQEQKTEHKSESNQDSGSDTSSNNNHNNNNNNHNSGGGSTEYTGGKLGLAFPNPENDLSHYHGNGKTFLYNWRPQGPSNAAAQGFSFAPMLWGRDIGNFHQVVDSGNYDILLGFNEVNEPGQASMGVGEALDIWYKHMIQYQDSHQMWSPSVSSRPNGLQWLKDFVAGCHGCKIDCIAVHWYDISVQNLQEYLGNFHSAFPDKDLCLTEFAFQNFNGNNQPSPDQIHGMMAEAQGWMNSQDWIKVYAPFGFMRDMVNVNPANQLMDPGSGAPNDFGRQILGSAH